MPEAGSLTASKQAMVDLWEEHVACEFDAQSTEKTLSTMTSEPINVPLLTGGVGLAEVRKYYSEYFKLILESSVRPLCYLRLLPVATLAT